MSESTSNEVSPGFARFGVTIGGGNRKLRLSTKDGVEGSAGEAEKSPVGSSGKSLVGGAGKLAARGLGNGVDRLGDRTEVSYRGGSFSSDTGLRGISAPFGVGLRPRPNAESGPLLRSDSGAGKRPFTGERERTPLRWLFGGSVDASGSGRSGWQVMVASASAAKCFEADARTVSSGPKDARSALVRTANAT